MAIFSKPELKFARSRKHEMPEGLWVKCVGCKEMLPTLALEQNLQVCTKCGHHFPIKTADRIRALADPGTFEEIDADLRPLDPLEFTGLASYAEKLREYQERTGSPDAVRTGLAKLEGREIALALMNFEFLAATMGSVVGEKITRLIEEATARRAPIIIVCASGGARMYEGMLSLMQMAKTSAALARHSRARVPYISILTNPTTAGVMASFASLGDLIVAEPKAMVGFAGPRVVRETTHQDLPSGFQTAEFLQKHGLIDLIVPRTRLRETLSQLLDYLCLPQ